MWSENMHCSVMLAVFNCLLVVLYFQLCIILNCQVSKLSLLEIKCRTSSFCGAWMQRVGNSRRLSIVQSGMQRSCSLQEAIQQTIKTWHCDTVRRVSITYASPNCDTFCVSLTRKNAIWSTGSSELCPPLAKVIIFYCSIDSQDGMTSTSLSWVAPDMMCSMPHYRSPLCAVWRQIVSVSEARLTWTPGKGAVGW